MATLLQRPHRIDSLVNGFFKEDGGEVLDFVANSLKLIIDSCTLKRWYDLKEHFLCKSNEELLIKLLDITEKYCISGAPRREATPPESLQSCFPQTKEIVEPDKPILKTTKLKTKLVSRKEGNESIEPQLPMKEDNGKSKLEVGCRYCDKEHSYTDCPVNCARDVVCDSMSLTDWSFKEDDESVSFASMSLPNCLHISNTKTGGVVAKAAIKPFTKFGPLVGKKIKEVDIPDESDMMHIWELQLGFGNVYINTEDPQTSNWLRFVQPAPTREERNLTVVLMENNLYLVSIKPIKCEDELLYWQDTFTPNNRKKLERTVCGGCNMTFAHPLYYRLHCSLFHDMRFSLTIRKYHCKVCGAAILGKENIRKHATEFHDGKGAYQCQFCKKYFLRLSYLDMHRTYGCSSNPLRSKSLCDFCGRNFCQPQKLKIHIKRMHSNLTEVLNDFQCKKCSKILGSRAALQRHNKEVHQKQQDNSYTCPTCNKNFQNKSNLKIHMLTHSGVKPFKCNVGECAAAFTTKQCLQLHYRKIHNFDEKTMPKIVRSVSYTFQAYSGSQEEQEKKRKEQESEAEILEDCGDSPEIFDGVDLESPNDLSAPYAASDKDALSPEINQLESVMKSSENTKIPTKGSKKWITDTLDIESTIDDGAKLDDQTIPKYACVSEFSRRETSNASLLVEAALGSVCNDASMDIDVEVSHNCSDSLVGNIYNLSDENVLQDYSIPDSHDVNLISPSVNDHISVTDELDSEIKNGHDIQIDYLEDEHNMRSRNESSRPASVDRELQERFSRTHQDDTEYPVPVPRYDFGDHITTQAMSSEDSNDMPTIASDKNMDNEQSLCLDTKSSFKAYDYFKRLKFDEKASFFQTNNQTSEIEPNINDLTEKESIDKYNHETSADLRNRFEIDFDIRVRHYDYSNLESDLTRQRSLYSMCNNETSPRAKVNDLTIPSDNRDPTDIDFRSERHFESLNLNNELQGLDMSTRSYHNYPSNINRYHHVYPDLDGLRLNYTPPPPYDLVRVVSLDLTPPGRHSVDLSLRGIPIHQIANSRLLTEHSLTNKHRIFDQARLLASDLSTRMNDNRLIPETGPRLISDPMNSDRVLAGPGHISGSEQPLLTDDRLLSDHSRIIDQRPPMLGDHLLQSSGPSLSAFGSYAGVAQPSYHAPPTMDPRSHVTSPVNTGYHHPYSGYYP